MDPTLIHVVLGAIELLKVPKKLAKKRVIILTKTDEGPRGFVTFAELMKHGEQLVPEDFGDAAANEVCTTFKEYSLPLTPFHVDVLDFLFFGHYRTK